MTLTRTSYYKNNKIKKVTAYEFSTRTDKDVYVNKTVYNYRKNGKRSKKVIIIRTDSRKIKSQKKYYYNKKGQLKPNKFGKAKRVVYYYKPEDKIIKRITHNYNKKGKLVNKKTKNYK